MSDYDWKVHISYEWETMSDRLFIHRSTSEGTQVIVGFDTTSGGYSSGAPITETFPDAHQPSFRGFRLPSGVIRAIAEQAKPGPSQAEIDRLQEALDFERYRVDRVIDRFVEQGGES
jgi:hypothetical protein